MVKRLLMLNGLAVIGVGIHHAAAYGFLAMFDWVNVYRDVIVPNYDMMGSLPYYVLLVIRHLDSFAIPAFLFVSGFFVAFASGKDGKMKWDAVLSRVKKFLGPFVIWTAVFFLLLQTMPKDLNDLLRVYYYIPLTIQYYFLSPILGPWAKKHWKSLLIITAIIQFGIQSLEYIQILGVSSPILRTAIRSTPTWFFPSRIFYFSLGLTAGLHRNLFSSWFTRAKYTLLFAVVFFAVMSIVEYEMVDRAIGDQWLGPNFIGIFRTLYATTFSLTFLAFNKVKLPFEKKLNQLGSMSLGVYLVNTPAIYVVSSLMYHFIPWTLGYQIIYQPILIIAALGGPIMLMTMLNISRARRYYPYVFGG
jgi:probable poly-beta-1,6-N-acetyl-D-glucosamine export protein